MDEGVKYFPPDLQVQWGGLLWLWGMSVMLSPRAQLPSSPMASGNTVVAKRPAPRGTAG